jgi:hypothetical protein
VSVIPLRRRRPLPDTPAFGTSGPAGRRRWIAVPLTLVLLLGAALGLRASGVLESGPSDRSLPALLVVATVAPGLLRGGRPSDVDLLRLRDDHGVRAVVDVEGMDVEEQATTRALGLRTLQLRVTGAGPPTAAEVLSLVRFLRSTVAARPGPAGTGVIYLHDGDGRGPVLITAALLRVLRGVPAATALDDLRATSGRAVTDDEIQALFRIGSYAALRGASW